MQKKIAVSICFAILIISFLNSASATEEVAFWGVKTGDEYQWKFTDDYYLINEFISTDIDHSASYLSDDTLRFAEYEYVKDWSQGYLQCDVGADDTDVDYIEIETLYLSVIGELTYIRRYAFDGIAINTNIPWKIDPTEEVQANDFVYSIDGSGFIDGFIPFLPEEDWNLTETARYQYFGSVTIRWLDAAESEIDTLQYAFGYTNPTYTDTTPYETYGALGFETEIVDMEDSQYDTDEIDDLLVMNTNSIEKDGIEVRFPGYIDITLITDIISIILFENGSFPFTTGFTLPSGMTTVYSEPAMALKIAIDNSDDLFNKIIIPGIVGDGLSETDLEEFFANFETEGMSFVDIFNVLTLISLTNFYILPINLNYEAITSAIELVLDFALVSLTRLFDEMGVSSDVLNAILPNIIQANNQNDLYSIKIDSNYLPPIFDTRNGPAAIGLEFQWNKTLGVMEKVQIRFDFGNGYGHVLGITREHPEVVEKGWISNIVEGLILFSSILGISVVGVIVRERKKKHHIKYDSLLNDLE